MSNERWRQISQLYHEALTHDPAERSAFLAAAATDPTVRAEVASLLANEDAARAFLETPAIEPLSIAPDDVAIGRQIGPYEIFARLGAGGMGEVYRARDTRLGRDVAIKLLPEAFVADTDRRVRFEREARLLAALNDPHIAQVYGIEQIPSAADGHATFALVMELVDGETLDRLIDRGLTTRQSLAIAGQIAGALAAAHDKGIIHRDLKPANVTVSAQGVVKVLDFGLAKAVTEAPETPGGTRAGTILGTATYMSPEQARGLPVDKRTDIWAFGCVFYEMLTGRVAFPGDTIPDTIATILEREPDWSALPAATPPGITRLLRRCLEKDAARRLRDAGDARIEIDDAPPAMESIGAATSGVPPRRDRRGLIAAVCLVAGVGLGAALMWARQRPVPAVSPPPARFAITLPASQTFMNTDGVDRTIAISADGAYMAYTVDVGTTTLGQLVVRALDRLDAQPLEGITNARAPFFSPNGEWIGFFQTGELKKVRITGGAPVTICKTNGPPRGGSWGADDTIIFATFDAETGLFSVPAGGGDARLLTRPDAARGEADHLFPALLPGGRAVLFTVTAAGAPIANAQVALLDLATNQWTTLIRDGSQAEYIEPGYVVYAVNGALRAVRFDRDRLAVTGAPVPVLDHVVTLRSGAAQFATARTGALVYGPGSSVEGSGVMRSLVWTTREGNDVAIAAPARAYWTLRLSPDGTRLALEARDQDNDIWIWDGHALTRLTSDPELDAQPIWTRDGRRIVYSSARTGFSNLYEQNADGTGAVDRLASTPFGQWPMTISSDGALIVLEEKAGGDLGAMALSGGGRPITPVVQTPFGERNAELSPDGHWLAYQSNESGEPQIYVKPYPSVDAGRWTISGAGGTQPAWAPSGRELFYIDHNNRFTVVPVRSSSQTTFEWGTPATLVATGMAAAPKLGRSYDIARDGRIVHIKDVPADPTLAPAPSLVAVLNWVEELKKKLQTP